MKHIKLVLITLLVVIMASTMLGCSKTNNKNIKNDLKVEDTEMYIVKSTAKLGSITKIIKLYENGIVIVKLDNTEEEEIRYKISDEDMSMLKDILGRDKYAKSWVDSQEQNKLKSIGEVESKNKDISKYSYDEDLIRVVNALLTNAITKNLEKSA